jgi:hypothetical protein
VKVGKRRSGKKMKKGRRRPGNYEEAHVTSDNSEKFAHPTDTTLTSLLLSRS